MREARTLGSWAIALFLAVLLLLAAFETLAPQPPAKQHLFEVFRASSDIAYFEPTGRFVTGLLMVLAALMVLTPFTRRIGAILAALIMVVLGALVVQLMMLGIKVPVDTVADGVVTTKETDPSALFYLILGLLVASAALVIVHPGRSAGEHA